jgi:hypothetical protein
MSVLYYTAAPVTAFWPPCGSGVSFRRLHNFIVPQILVLAPVKWQNAQQAADTPQLTGINFRNFTFKQFF